MKTVIRLIIKILLMLLLVFCLFVVVSFLLEKEFSLAIVFSILCLSIFVIFKNVSILVKRKFEKPLGKNETIESTVFLPTSVDTYDEVSSYVINNPSSCDESVYDFSTIDFETANESMGSACSIGLVSVKDGCIVNEYYSLIKPMDLRVKKVNYSIHGISEEMLQDEKEISELWDRISEIIKQSRYIIAHNAQFDMSVLYQSTKNYDIAIDNFKYLDSINICAKYTNGAGNKLSQVAEYFGVNLGTHHNALDDARTAALCVLKSMETSGAPTFSDFVQKNPSLKAKEFKDLKSNENFAKSKKIHSVKISDITTENADFDTSHPFYGKTIVLTGNFVDYSRKEMMQLIVDVGGIVRSSVSRKTDYLVVGEQDNDIVGDDGLSGKQEKALALIEDGYDIKIIYQNDLHLYI